MGLEGEGQEIVEVVAGFLVLGINLKRPLVILFGFFQAKAGPISLAGSVKFIENG